MGRRKRNGNSGDTETNKPAVNPASDVQGAPGLGQAVRVRMTFPCCGMMPEVGRFGNAPYAPQVRIQRFGGSVPATEDQPMRAFMEYGFGTPHQELEAALLWLAVSEAASVAVLELLPDIYIEAGQVPLPVVASGNVAEILDQAPTREDLLARLLTGDTFAVRPP